MHIIESGDLAKPVATLSPLTKLSCNDAYHSTYYPVWAVGNHLAAVAVQQLPERPKYKSTGGFSWPDG